MARKRLKRTRVTGLVLFGLSTGSLYLLAPLLETDSSLALPAGQETEPPEEERFQAPPPDPDTAGAVLANLFDPKDG